MSRIYVVMPWFGTFAGGAPSALTSIANALAACGLDVSILTTCSKSPYQDWQLVQHEPGVETVGNVGVHRFRVDTSDMSEYHRAVQACAAGEVPEELQQAFYRVGLNSADLVRYVCELPESARIIAGPYFQALVPSLVNACPNRVTVMPAFHAEPQLSWSPVRKMAQNAKGFLFLSEEEKSLAVQHHGAAAGRRLVEAPVVGLAVELPAAYRDANVLAEATLTASMRYGLPTEYFLYCGRIEEGKGVGYLLKWYRQWLQLRAARGEEACPLVLVGGGYPDIIPKEPGFVHLGFLPDEHKFAVMHGAAALINPSTVESFSYVLMESWLVQRPVIVPEQCAVTAGHVRRSGGGLTFRDEQEFFDALDTLLDESKAGLLGLAGERYVRSTYSWPGVLDRLLGALDILCQ